MTHNDDLFLTGLLAGADTGGYRNGYQDGYEKGKADERAAIYADIAARALSETVVEAVRAAIYENRLRPAYVGAEEKETAYAATQIQKVLLALGITERETTDER